MKFLLNTILLCFSITLLGCQQQQNIKVSDTYKELEEPEERSQVKHLELIMLHTIN